MSKKYYIPIKTTSLPYYYSHAIIAPAKYFENRASDIQNSVNNQILLCSEKFTTDTNCAIEVVFNEVEEQPTPINEKFFIFNMPLPLTRIRKIIFDDEKKMKRVKFNINDGVGFLNEELLSVENPTNRVPTKNLKVEVESKDWSASLKKYNHLMGGFALMRIGKLGDYNYPEYYIDTLSNVNKNFSYILVENELEIYNKYKFAFTDTGKRNHFRDAIYEKITLNTVEEFASKETLKLDKNLGIIDLNKIPKDKLTYNIAVLGNYTHRKTETDFITDLLNGVFPNDKIEGLALSMGINKGYASLRNTYSDVDVKFRLDSQFEYYIIESIYQNVFNNLDNIESFPYLDSWCAKKNIDNSIVKDYDTYQVLDELIILSTNKKKVDFFNGLWTYSSAENQNKICQTISEKVTPWFPQPFVTFDKTQINQYFANGLNEQLWQFYSFLYEKIQKNIESKNKKTLEKQVEKHKSETDELNKKIKELEQENIRLKSINNQVQEKNTDIVEERANEIVGESNVKYKKNSDKNQGIKQQLDNSKSQQSNITQPELFEDKNQAKEKRLKELEKLKKPGLIDIGEKLNINTKLCKNMKELIQVIIGKEFPI